MQAEALKYSLFLTNTFWLNLILHTNLILTFIVTKLSLALYAFFLWRTPKEITFEVSIFIRLAQVKVPMYFYVIHTKHAKCI